MLPIPSVVEVNGADFDVRVEGVNFEKKLNIRRNEQMDMTRQVFVLEVLDCVLQSNDVPFPRDVFFDGAFFCSSRSRIQFSMLRRVCSGKRLGTSLLNRYSGFG